MLVTLLPWALYGTFWYICLRLRRFDISQGTFSSCFGNQFEAKNSIFSQEHVFGEDIHAMNSLRTKSICEGVVAKGGRELHIGTVGVQDEL